MPNKKIILLIVLSLITCPLVNGDDSMEDVIALKINDETFDVKLENNAAADELSKILEKQNITINASDYGNFEKVGDLGYSLPTSDENINTESGDIVLYQGNQISLFYNSHSWSYTKIGKIQNIDSAHLKEVLGREDVTLVLSGKN